MKEQLIKGALLPRMKRYLLDEWVLPISTLENSKMDNLLFSFAEAFDLEGEVASILQKGYVTIKGSLPEEGYRSSSTCANILGVLLDSYIVHKLGDILMKNIVIPELLLFATFDYTNEDTVEESLTNQDCQILYRYSYDSSHYYIGISYKLGLKEDATSVLNILKKSHLVEKQANLLRTFGAVGDRISIPLSLPLPLGREGGDPISIHLAIQTGDFMRSVVKLAHKRG